MSIWQGESSEGTRRIEDPDFSNGVLKYIDEMLMDEDMDVDEDKGRMIQSSLDFQAKERSFYELLGHRYPYPYPPQQQHNAAVHTISSITTPTTYAFPANYNHVSNSSSITHPQTQVIWDFSKGAKVNGSEETKYCQEEDEEEQEEKEEENTDNPCNLPQEELDDLWTYTLGGRDKEFTSCITDLKNAQLVERKKKGKLRRAKKRRGKEDKEEEEVIDPIPLLLDCAKSLAADDHVAATELLRQIRHHSSPLGDANQRLAHYFADGLEARLGGTATSRIQRALVHERSISSQYLRVYCTSLMSSSFRKLSIFASNNIIASRLKKAKRVHVIDFGISYGFQWPPFIRRLAGRKGGPPMLRITGVDFPQPGSRPEERIEETGHRLARYAKAFGVPFEYHAISKNWENIRVKDLKIMAGEFVAVNCLYRAKNLPDEAGLSKSSRSIVLELIRKINPDVFVHGIVNGAYGAPFFLTRFREALYHFSTLFDMNETIIPRDSPERLLIESEILGNEATNVIACEGQERVERPETYKQWHGRHLKAGLVQLPIKSKLFGAIINKVKNSYHREFVVLEDKNWLLMSWKGRTICALSNWQPA